VNIEFELNNRPVAMDVEPGATLLSVLREGRQYSVKTGCETGDCGACTVLLNGQPVNSCVVPAGRIQGQKITTLEGLLADPLMNDLQKSMVDAGAVQCGYCSPGLLISLYSHIKNDGDHLDEDSIRHSLTGNLCRCTGYVKPVEAALEVIKNLEGK
jgi:aerobic-type carbon monoxide dehydrogenase small subunit (CoxS/CutS family)